MAVGKRLPGTKKPVTNRRYSRFPIGATPAVAFPIRNRRCPLAPSALGTTFQALPLGASIRGHFVDTQGLMADVWDGGWADPGQEPIRRMTCPQPGQRGAKATLSACAAGRLRSGSGGGFQVSRSAGRSSATAAAAPTRGDQHFVKKPRTLLNRAGRQSRFAPAAALRFFVALGKALAQAASDAQCRHSPGEDRGPRSRLGCAASPAPEVLLRFRRPGWGYSTL